MTEEEKQIENQDASVTNSPDSLQEPVAEAVPTPTAASSNQGTTPEPETQSMAEPVVVGTPPIDTDGVEISGVVDQEALDQLAQEVESLRFQLEEQENLYKRIAADFDNFRKRVQKEKEDLVQQAKRNTLSELLPVVDSFERARSHLKPQSDQEAAIHKSYQGIYKQLVDCLKRIGVAPMRPEGKEFDPNLHEAVMREATDEYPEGTIVEQLIRGYLLGDRVLRHAMVKVAAAPEPASAVEDSELE